MGINFSWKDDVFTAFEDLSAKPEQSGAITLLHFNNERFILHLVSLSNALKPEDMIVLQEKYADSGILLVHLWEDVWKKKSTQVMSRVISALGQNTRIHARKTKLITINQKQYDEFLNGFHLQGTAKARYKFALVTENQIAAVAGFSGIRKMKHISEDYNSAELIRFATRAGITVTGGMSKLITHFIKLIRPDDIMSYADRDWSLGKAYIQSGFKLKEVTPPSELWVDSQTMLRYFLHRLPEDVLPGDKGRSPKDNPRYVKIFNTGNLKYILTCPKIHS